MNCCRTKREGEPVRLWRAGGGQTSATYMNREDPDTTLDTMTEYTGYQVSNMVFW